MPMRSAARTAAATPIPTLRSNGFADALVAPIIDGVGGGTPGAFVIVPVSEDEVLSREEGRGLGGVVIVVPGGVVIVAPADAVDDDGEAWPCSKKLSLVTDTVELVLGGVSVTEASDAGVTVAGPVTTGTVKGPVPVWEVGWSVWAMVAVVLPALLSRYVVSCSHGGSPLSPMSIMTMAELEKMVAVTIVT